MDKSIIMTKEMFKGQWKCARDLGLTLFLPEKYEDYIKEFSAEDILNIIKQEEEFQDNLIRTYLK